MRKDWKDTVSHNGRNLNADLEASTEHEGMGTWQRALRAREFLFQDGEKAEKQGESEDPAVRPLRLLSWRGQGL